jgi:hypothetical protein
MFLHFKKKISRKQPIHLFSVEGAVYFKYKLHGGLIWVVSNPRDGHGIMPMR